MTSYDVYHAKQPNFGLSLGQNSVVFPEDFQKVAVVRADSLEEVFCLTNHIENDWTENPEVQADRHCRSTSPGDIVVNSKGEVCLCKMMGWEVIGNVCEGNLKVNPEF